MKAVTLTGAITQVNALEEFFDDGDVRFVFHINELANARLGCWMEPFDLADLEMVLVRPLQGQYPGDAHGRAGLGCLRVLVDSAAGSLIH